MRTVYAVYLKSMVSAWNTSNESLQPRITLGVRAMEPFVKATRNEKKVVNSVPTQDGLVDWENLWDNRVVPFSELLTSAANERWVVWKQRRLWNYRCVPFFLNYVYNLQIQVDLFPAKGPPSMQIQTLFKILKELQNFERSEMVPVISRNWWTNDVSHTHHFSSTIE